MRNYFKNERKTPSMQESLFLKTYNKVEIRSMIYDVFITASKEINICFAQVVASASATKQKNYIYIKSFERLPAYQM